MPAPVSYPTAREVAVAIVTAARACDENPETVARGSRGGCAKWYAIAALNAVFPTCTSFSLARLCGHISRKSQENALPYLRHNLSRGLWNWWRDDTLHQVKVALYAEMARTDARLRAPARAAEPAMASAHVAKRHIPIGERVAKVVSAEADARAARALVPVSTEGVALSYRPDAPAHERNVDIHTAALMGDPKFERSALYMRQHGGHDETKTEETAGGI